MVVFILSVVDIILIFLLISSRLEIKNIKDNQEYIGKLRIVHIDGEQPSIFLELEKSPNFIGNVKEAVLDISHEKPII